MANTIMSHHIEDFMNALLHHFLILAIVSLLLINLLFIGALIFDHYFDGGNVLLLTIADMNGRTYARHHPFDTILNRLKCIVNELNIFFDDFWSGERESRL